MQNGIIKGTGDSRYLKSAIPAGTTWEQALAMLQAGTFPIDLNGINAAGWQQLATALGKAALLKDATAAQYGLGANAVPDDVFSALAEKIGTIKTTLRTDLGSKWLLCNGANISGASYPELANMLPIGQPSQTSLNTNETNQSVQKVRYLNGKTYVLASNQTNAIYYSASDELGPSSFTTCALPYNVSGYGACVDIAYGAGWYGILLGRGYVVRTKDFVTFNITYVGWQNVRGIVYGNGYGCVGCYGSGSSYTGVRYTTNIETTSEWTSTVYSNGGFSLNDLFFLNGKFVIPTNNQLMSFTAPTGSYTGECYGDFRWAGYADGKYFTCVCTQNGGSADWRIYYGPTLQTANSSFVAFGQEIYNVNGSWFLFSWQWGNSYLSLYQGRTLSNLILVQNLDIYQSSGYLTCSSVNNKKMLHIDNKLMGSSQLRMFIGDPTTAKLPVITTTGGYNYVKALL